MYHFFEVTELVQKLTNLLDLTDQYHFGLSCRIIWRAAFPVMWSCPISAQVLRGLFPEDVYVVNCDLSSKQVHLSRSLTQDEWYPILGYSKYIRHLTLNDSEAANAEEDPAQDVLDVFGFLLSYLSSPSNPDRELLLPNLRALDVQLHDLDNLVACAILLNDTSQPIAELSVKAVDQLVPSEDERVLYFIRGVGNLRQLTLLDFNWRIGGDWGKLGHAFATAFSAKGTPDLEALTARVSVVGDGVALINSLAALRSFQRLNIETHSEGAHSGYQLPPDAFGSLNTLEIWRVPRPNYHPLDMVQLFRAITSTQLAEIAIICTTTALAEILALLGTKWPSSAIDITVDLTGQDGTAFVVQFQELRPLTRCVNLERLVLKSLDFVEIIVVLSDEDYDVMSLAWPNLRYLDPSDHVGSGSGIPPPLLATRRSLSYFAARCPNLEHLRLSVNFDVNVEEGGTWGPSNLAELNLERSTSSRPAETVEFLRSTFPKLKRIPTGGGQGMREVVELLGVASNHPVALA